MAEKLEDVEAMLAKLALSEQFPIEPGCWRTLSTTSKPSGSQLSSCTC
ncbi:MAG: hypothetical protein QW407_06225 [Thermofilaceae archaeon]